MRYPTIKQRETLRDRLHAKIAALQGEIDAALRRSGRAGKGAGLANHLEEIDDEAVADLETSIEIAAIERDVRELREAESALERLAAPDYGSCIDCGEKIPYTRLHANPVALRCTGCQRAQERRTIAGAPSL